MRSLLSTAVCIAAAAGVAAAHAGAPGSGPDRGRMELIASVRHAVSLTSAPVTGLYPGARKPLTLRIRNTYGYPVKVAKVRAKLAAATSRTGCAGSPGNLLVSSGGRAVIKPGRTKAVVMTVVMPLTVADACQGATFRITFTVHATR